MSAPPCTSGEKKWKVRTTVQKGGRWRRIDGCRNHNMSPIHACTEQEQKGHGIANTQTEHAVAARLSVHPTTEHRRQQTTGSFDWDLPPIYSSPASNLATQTLTICSLMVLLSSSMVRIFCPAHPTRGSKRGAGTQSIDWIRRDPDATRQRQRELCQYSSSNKND